MVNALSSTRADANQIAPEDLAAHDWYRFVLSFPPHLVREYLDRFGIDHRSRVLDPFCGTGTTLVECKKRGVPSVGVEANPLAHFASAVKVDWSPDPAELARHARSVALAAYDQLMAQGIDDDPILPRPCPSTALRRLPDELAALLLADSISPLPLHKTLVLLDTLRSRAREEFNGHERLALARALVNSISNLHFGPEVGVGPAKADAPVISTWLNGVCKMARDLEHVQTGPPAPSEVHYSDSRRICEALEPGSVDAVITSPPYPNEKDYTRTTRLESVLLGFISSKEELRSVKKTLVRSNTRGVYRDDTDDGCLGVDSEVAQIADLIEARRIEMGKTSGFERQYARVTRLYFGGMARHLAEMRPILRSGAQLAYVVGDQASYLRVMIRTGRLLADIAASLGYKVVGLELFRTRLATATREQLREEVLVLRWPGSRATRLPIRPPSLVQYRSKKTPLAPFQESTQVDLAPFYPLTSITGSVI